MEGKKLVGDYVAGGLALALAFVLALALDDGGGGDGDDGGGVDSGAEELGVIEVTLS